MTTERPVIFRIPFSHYCQKAEWGLTQAGIPYDCIDISLGKMVRLSDVTPTGLVPAMLVDGHLIEGSDRIMQWAAGRASDETLPLFPAGHAAQAREWEYWAGEEVGPVARREAYRVAYNDPWHFTRNPVYHVAVRAANKLILGVVKYYKMRRYEDHDAEAVPRIVAKVAAQLGKTGTGYLLTDHPTAADHSVAALARPLLYAEPGRDYADLPGWTDLAAFVDRVRPRTLTRKRTRSIRAKDWAALSEASAPAA